MDWKPVTELKQIEEDISSFGYTKKYIDEYRLHDMKSPHGTNGITGQVDFFEPLEVKEQDGEIFYRENENHIHMEKPEIFRTQYGIFNNHNNGEFTSWLGRADFDGLSDKEIHRLFGRGNFYIEGNFCDMFDCGEYSYAISNLMYMGLGWFKIVRIDKNLATVDIYDNKRTDGWTCLEYDGCFRNEHGYIVIVSGFTEVDREKGDKRNFQDRTILLQIAEDGSCTVSNEWQIKISSSNSMAKAGDYVYFGQNKMVTKLNIISGELKFLTNKSDEELAALKPMW